MGGPCGTHELLHTLGFIHEQSRRDRDYYTAFNWTNLDPGKILFSIVGITDFIHLICNFLRKSLSCGLTFKTYDFF